MSCARWSPARRATGASRSRTCSCRDDRGANSARAIDGAHAAAPRRHRPRSPARKVHHAKTIVSRDRQTLPRAPSHAWSTLGRCELSVALPPRARRRLRRRPWRARRWRAGRAARRRTDHVLDPLHPLSRIRDRDRPRQRRRRHPPLRALDGGVQLASQAALSPDQSRSRSRPGTARRRRGRWSCGHCSAPPPTSGARSHDRQHVAALVARRHAPRRT